MALFAVAKGAVVVWVESLRKRHRSGLSIEEMRDYLQLCLQGKESIPERKIMLARKRELLVDELNEIQASIDFLDWKQSFYDDVLAGRTEYFSNLVPQE